MKNALRQFFTGILTLMPGRAGPAAPLPTVQMPPDVTAYTEDKSRELAFRTDTLFPLEVVVQGTPVTHQSTNKARKEAWKALVKDLARDRQHETYELGFLDDRALAVTIFYFPSDPMLGDVDNIVKLILDAMIDIAYPDDRYVERVTVQKFEPDVPWHLRDVTSQLAMALDTEPPVLYIRVEDDLRWRDDQ